MESGGIHVKSPDRFVDPGFHGARIYLGFLSLRRRGDLSQGWRYSGLLPPDFRAGLEPLIGREGAGGVWRGLGPLFAEGLPTPLSVAAPEGFALGRAGPVPVAGRSALAGFPCLGCVLGAESGAGELFLSSNALAGLPSPLPLPGPKRRGAGRRVCAPSPEAGSRLPRTICTCSMTMPSSSA